MIYKFKSKATGDLIMTQPVGDRVLSLIGKPATPQGIIEVDQMAGRDERAGSRRSPPRARRRADDDDGAARRPTASACASACGRWWR